MFDWIGDIFSGGIQSILSKLINEALDIPDCMLENIQDIAFNAQDYMTNNMNMKFESIFVAMNLFGLYLIVLKFLKKGFDTYVLWNDGDADMDPFVMCTGFFKAIIVTLSFDTLYGFMIKIAMELTDKVLSSMNNVNLTAASMANLISTLLAKSKLLMIIIAFIYMILYLLLWLQFVKRGLELFVLKAGIPIACVGLMDSDGGVFRPYIKKFFQEVFTVMIQVVMLKMSFAFMLTEHYLFGFAAISFALKAPQFLQEFVMISSGGQGVVSKASQTVHTANMVRSFVK